MKITYIDGKEEDFPNMDFLNAVGNMIMIGEDKQDSVVYFIDATKIKSWK